MPEPFIGQIVTLTRGDNTSGWAACDGTLLSIQQNQALFSVLGTTYGGDGVRTFALPDLRERTTLRWGEDPGLIATGVSEKRDQETIPLNPYLSLVFMIATQGISAPRC